MICEKCKHEWDGEMATCPICGHLPAGASGINGIAPPADPSSTAKLRLKFKDLPPHKLSQATEQPDPVPDMPDQSAAEANPFSAEEAAAKPELQPGETAEFLAHEIADTANTGVSYSFRKNRQAEDDSAEAYSPPEAPSGKPVGRTAFKLVLLLLVLAACGIVAVVRPPCFVTNAMCLFKEKKADPTANVSSNSDIVQIKLTNVSGKPLILRIGNRVIALDNGQTMQKTVSKGVHDISWRCDIGGETLSGSLEDEKISSNDSWKFELVARERERQVIRTTGPRS